MRYPNWISISLDAIVANYAWVKNRSEDAQVICVVKGNAYGHGLRETAQALQAAGAGYFAVSCLREALALRACGIAGDILVMGHTGEGGFSLALRHRIILTVISEPDAMALQRAAARAGDIAQVCLKVDTGFHRLGFDAFAHDTEQQLLRIAALPALRVEGIFSHLALRNGESDAMQAAAFLDLTENLTV